MAKKTLQTALQKAAKQIAETLKSRKARRGLDAEPPPLSDAKDHLKACQDAHEAFWKKPSLEALDRYRYALESAANKFYDMQQKAYSQRGKRMPPAKGTQEEVDVLSIAADLKALEKKYIDGFLIDVDRKRITATTGDIILTQEGYGKFNFGKFTITLLYEVMEYQVEAVTPKLGKSRDRTHPHVFLGGRLCEGDEGARLIPFYLGGGHLYEFFVTVEAVLDTKKVDKQRMHEGYSLANWKAPIQECKFCGETTEEPEDGAPPPEKIVTFHKCKGCNKTVCANCMEGCGSEKCKGRRTKYCPDCSHRKCQGDHEGCPNCIPYACANGNGHFCDEHRATCVCCAVGICGCPKCTRTCEDCGKQTYVTHGRHYTCRRCDRDMDCLSPDCAEKTPDGRYKHKDCNAHGKKIQARKEAAKKQAEQLAAAPADPARPTITATAGFEITVTEGDWATIQNPF